MNEHKVCNGGDSIRRQRVKRNLVKVKIKKKKNKGRVLAGIAKMVQKRGQIIVGAWFLIVMTKYSILI